MTSTGTRFDFSITRAQDYQVSIYAQNSTGAAIDLSAYTLTGDIKRNNCTGILQSFNFTIATPATSGIFTMGLTNAQTAALPVGLLNYDVFGIISGTYNQFLYRGMVNVNNAITLP